MKQDRHRMPIEVSVGSSIQILTREGRDICAEKIHSQLNYDSRAFFAQVEKVTGMSRKVQCATRQSFLVFAVEEHSQEYHA